MCVEKASRYSLERRRCKTAVEEEEEWRGSGLWVAAGPGMAWWGRSGRLRGGAAEPSSLRLPPRHGEDSEKLPQLVPVKDVLLVVVSPVVAMIYVVSMLGCIVRNVTGVVSFAKIGTVNTSYCIILYNT